MAQGRMIRKSITTDSKVGQLDTFCKLLYTWSILFADREGRINANWYYVKYVIGQSLDSDDCDVQQALLEWAEAGLCVLYEDVDGQYIQFNNFRRLQGMENDSGMTALYKRERASVFPEPASCKIIAGQSHCNLQAVDEQSSLDAVEKNDDFIDQVKGQGHGPEAYEPMNANEVLTQIFSWFKQYGKNIMIPAGALDWTLVSGEMRGIAKNIGKLVTPIRLNIILGYIETKRGFAYGVCTPLVYNLVKEWNDTELKALEGL